MPFFIIFIFLSFFLTSCQKQTIDDGNISQFRRKSIHQVSHLKPKENPPTHHKQAMPKISGLQKHKSLDLPVQKKMFQLFHKNDHLFSFKPETSQKTEKQNIFSLKPAQSKNTIMIQLKRK